MSLSYPEYTYTNFPDKIDTFNYFTDINVTNLSLANQYYDLYKSGNIAAATALLEANPSLKSSFIGASTLNPLVDAIKAIEHFYSEDVQQYLINIVKDKGDYSTTTKYAKYNVVGYYHNGATESYICLNSDTPIGTVPTNSTFWRPLTLRGEQGVAGIGLSPYGSWNPVIIYPADAMVAYDNSLWGSIIQNVNVTPSDTANTTWYKIIAFSPELLMFTDNVTNKKYKLNINNGTVHFDDGLSTIDLALKTDLENLDNMGITVSANEINYVAGIKSNIQDQIDSISTYVKQPTAPSNTNVLWIDTNKNLVKYYNGAAWVSPSAAWG